MAIDRSGLTASDYVQFYKNDWRCVLCDENSQLVWSLVHGECTCERCDAPYTFFPDGYSNPASDIPHSLIRDNYLEAVRKVYEEEGGKLGFWHLALGRIEEVYMELALGE